MKDGMTTHAAADNAKSDVHNFVMTHQGGIFAIYTDIAVQNLGGNIAIP